MFSRCVRSRVMYVAARVTIRRARRDRRAPLPPWIISVPWRTCALSPSRSCAAAAGQGLFSRGASGRRRGQTILAGLASLGRRGMSGSSRRGLLALGLRQWRPARSCVLTQRCSDVVLAAASVCRAEDATCSIIIFSPSAWLRRDKPLPLLNWLAVSKTLASERAASVKAETRPLCGCQVCN